MHSGERLGMGIEECRYIETTADGFQVAYHAQLVRVRPGGRAARSGAHNGDVVLSVGDWDAAHAPVSEVRAKLKEFKLKEFCRSLAVEQEQVEGSGKTKHTIRLHTNLRILIAARTSKRDKP